MKLLTNWHLPIAFSLGAILAVAGSRVLEHRSLLGGAKGDTVDPAPTLAVFVPPPAPPVSRKRPAKAIRRAHTPPLLARPAKSPAPDPAVILLRE
jgi:hypothetical protein